MNSVAGLQASHILRSFIAQLQRLQACSAFFQGPCLKTRRSWSQQHCQSRLNVTQWRELRIAPVSWPCSDQAFQWDR